jgi:hypothetical protein
MLRARVLSPAAGLLLAVAFLASSTMVAVPAGAACPPPPAYPNTLGPLNAPCGPYVFPQAAVPCVPWGTIPPQAPLTTRSWSQPAVNGDGNMCPGFDVTGSYEDPCPTNNHVPVLSTPYQGDYCGAVPPCGGSTPLLPCLPAPCGLPSPLPACVLPVHLFGVAPGATFTCSAQGVAGQPFRTLAVGLDYDLDGSLDPASSAIDWVVVGDNNGVVSLMSLTLTNPQDQWGRVIAWVNDDFVHWFPGPGGFVDIDCW